MLTRRLSFGMSFVVGVLLAAPLLAVLYLAGVISGAPFPAFSVFDLVSRLLPGALVTAGIDAMVAVIRGLNLGRTDTAAKTGEQIMAILLFAALLVVLSFVFFRFIGPRLGRSAGKRSSQAAVGILFGALLGTAVAAVVAGLDRSGVTSPVLNWLWLLVAFGVWGLAHGWAFSALTRGEAASPSDAAAPAAAMPAIEPRATLAATSPQMSALNRRQFLITLGGASATVTLVGAGLSALLYNQTQSAAPQQAGLSPLSIGPTPTIRSEEGLVMPAPGTRAEITPVEQHYRIDINSGSPPRLEAETYRLALTGLLTNPAELTLDQVRGLGEPMHQYITMSCISNPLGGDLISTTLWTGVSMQRLLDFARPDPEATHLRITSTDGFYETLALDVVRSDPRVMLTYAFEGQPLPVRNGFPLRVHIPDHYGMKQPKWITGMEFIGEWQPGYWVDRGWDREARVRATSVIDSVAVDSIEQRDGQDVVPVGGIAWAGARGISRVQVKIDDGVWADAQLREPVSDKTWVIWRYDWPFEAGNHTFAVRCAERDGTPQIESMEGTRPSGATGIHVRTADVPQA